MGHLDSQRSLPVIGTDRTGLSSLAKKLRLTADHSLAALNVPNTYADLLVPGPREVRKQVRPGQSFDAVLLFVKDVEELRRLGPGAIAAAKDGGLLWIAYPKGGKVTDLPATPWWVQRDVLGEVTAIKGYKPVSFVAVDETWTALRFKKV
ncbi:MAG TPA: hypothetical protein VJS19_13145 [Candidatus Dormibacteraeota bacterium]|nr:hypothetical protein [Candidatus Dormibacteraeota bacterium]